MQETKKLKVFFKQLADANPEVAEVIDQFKEAALIFESIPPLKGELSQPEADPALFSQGKPLYQLDEWKLEELELAEAIVFVAPMLSTVLPEQTGCLEKIAEVIGASPELSVDLARWALKADEAALTDFAVKNVIEPNTLAYVVQNVFQVRAADVAARLKAKSAQDLSGWTHGYCPVCGQLANLSYIAGEGGARYLVCSACHNQWRYTRSACPYCATDKADNITLFYVDEKSGQKAAACQECNRYILTADLREKPDDIPYAHYLPYGMIPLDILMNDKNFEPGSLG